ncbi:MAG: hypothetical protein II029_06450 [Bacteroidales bacterium]|nr:hypothetical protein [Bacteroidales bacterium]
MRTVPTCVLTLMTVILMCSPASGQEVLGDDCLKRFEVTLSYGGAPFHHHRFDKNSFIIPSILMHNTIRYKTTEKSTMNVSLEGAWYFSNRLALTQVFSYHKMETGVYDNAKIGPNGSPKEWIYEQTPYYIYMAGLRVLYVNSDHYRLYGELNGGYVWKDNSLKYFEIFPEEAIRGFTAEIIPFAVQTTGRIFLNAELLSFGEYSNTDLSSTTLGIRIGVGCRF